jgi:AcrR family transcriptional regulator
MSKEKEIISTAIDLFVRNGYGNVTIQEICDSVGITKGTFYYHFKSKDELLLSYFDQQTNNIMTVLPAIVGEPDNREKIWLIFEFWIDRLISLGSELLLGYLVCDVTNGFRFFSPYSRLNKENARGIYDMLVEMIKAAQNAGDIQSNAEDGRLLTVMNAATIGLFTDWAANSGSFDVKSEIRAAFDCIFIAPQ